MLALPATPASLLRHVVVPALAMLPATFDSASARALLVAIAAQESGLKVRRQGAQVSGGVLGPARGLWQFEQTGVRGVLTHHTTDDLAAMILREAKFPLDSVGVHKALEKPEADFVACQLARLLLFTDPRPLPRVRLDAEPDAFAYYLRNWRPGAANTPKGREECARRFKRNWRAAVELCG